MRSRVHACLPAVVSFLVLSLAVGEASLAIRETGQPPKPKVSAQRAAALAVNSLNETSEGYRLDHLDYVATFNGQGLSFHPRRGGPGWSWKLKSVESRNEPLQRVTLGEISPLEQTTGVIGYDRGALIERYILRSDNIEQQFIIPESLDLAGSALLIKGQVDSPGELVATEKGWLWHTSDGVVSLGTVHVFDARGRTLPATMTATAQGTNIVVDGTGLETATYPVTIDPEIGTNDFRISNNSFPSDPNMDNNDPVVAYNSTNNEYLVVWRGDPGAVDGTMDNTEIFIQRIDAANGAQLGDGSQRISTMGLPLPGFIWVAIDPDVAYNSTNNEYLVVWEGDDNFGLLEDDEFEVWGQRIDGATGAEIGDDDFRISHSGPDGDPNFEAGDPAVAYNSTNNEYLVAWRGDDVTFGEFEVYGQRIDGATGAEVGATDFRISDMGPDGNPNFGASSLTMTYNSTNNEYLVVWRGDDGVDDELEVYGQRIDGETGAEIETNDFRISDLGPEGDPNFSASDPDVTYNNTNNEYLVVWRGDDITNGENEVYSQRLNAATGAEIGTNDFRVSDVGPDGDPDFDADDSNVAYNSTNNEFLIIWDADAVTDEAVEIYGQRFSDTARLRFAQFGNGGGFTSDLVLTNPSASAAVSGQVDFFDDDGLPLPIGIAGSEGAVPLAAETSPAEALSSVPFSVASLGKVTVSTDGQGDLAVGSAVVTSDGTLGGVVRFSIPGIGIAGVPVSQPLSGFLAPVRRQAGGINTGIAIHNTESQAVTLSLTLRDPQGVTVANGTETIVDFPASGHLAQFIGGAGETLFPDADTDDFEGTLVVEVTGGNVAATALELGTVSGQFTILPVTALE